MDKAYTEAMAGSQLPSTMLIATPWGGVQLNKSGAFWMKTGRKLKQAELDDILKWIARNK